MISSYATRANAIFIGLTETTTITNPSTPYISFSHVLYSDNTKLFRMDLGVLSSRFDVYPNLNPNYVFSVKYDNNNLYFYLDGQEAVNLRLNVGSGKTYYGCWSSYQNKTFSNIQWVPLAQGIQGNQGIQGIQGIQGVKGDTGSILSPVNNLVEFMDNVNITSTLNVSNQINSRALVASYEVAIVPSGTGTTSNLILGSNNNNNYIWYQNNSTSNPNELLLQYQNNTIQPSTTSTLINVLPSGNIQIGDLGNASPNVSISGSGGLGRIYDTIYNPPPSSGGGSNPLIGNFNINITPTWPFNANSPQTMIRTVLNQLLPANPAYSSYNVELDITNLQFTMNFSGETGTNSNFLLYLGSSSNQAYDATQMTGYSFNTPASTNTPYSSIVNITNSNITLSISTNVSITELFLICLLTPVPSRISNLRVSIPSFIISGIIKSYSSNSILPLTVYPSS
jgi:hypothetical protein